MRQILALLACGLCKAGRTFGDDSRAYRERRTLDKATDIQGYLFARGYVWFYNGGALSSCQLSREAAFGEATVPTGSWITLTPAGEPEFVSLRYDTRIGAATCMGSAMGPEGISTAFFPSGKLKECFLAADQEIQGVPCVHGGFMSELIGGNAVVQFYESGDLRSCRLSRAATVQGERFAKGARVHLNQTFGTFRCRSTKLRISHEDSRP